MNCRQCEHFHDVDGWNSERVKFDWPCARGVASLPQAKYIETHYYNDHQYATIQRLPWLIEEHDCPEFKEASQ